jgi:phosphopantetheinyl transferase (holo-ACP synthase)
MLQKYDILALMEFLEFPNPPESYTLVVTRVSGNESKSIDRECLIKHFPKRDITVMRAGRMLEHLAVAGGFTKALGHKDWHLEHMDYGGALLFINGQSSSRKVSISHAHDKDDNVLAAVIISESTQRIGVDLVFRWDERLARIAPRTMGVEEIESGNLAGVWAIKEAIFKAMGPGIDFKMEIKVQPSNKLPIVDATLRGVNSQWWLSELEGIVIALGPVA